MKLKRFNPANCPGYSETHLKIQFHNHGRVILTTLLVKHLGLKDGDHVEFCQDEAYRSDWYIVRSAHGFKLSSFGRSNRLQFYSMAFQKLFRDSLQLSLTKPETFSVSTDYTPSGGGEKLYPLITGKPKAA